MIRIAHFSDTHDHPSIVKAVGEVECDVIVLSGDILANKGRIRCTDVWGDDFGSARIHPPTEKFYQDRWFRKVAKKWAVAFQGRPVVSVPGNHDFIGIEKWLHHYGHTNIHTLQTGVPVEVCGKVFAGFREIPRMIGEWMGEAHPHEFPALIEATMKCNPDIIVTHAPPQGILDGPYGYGVPGWTAPIFYREHKVTHHLFGHAHEGGGQVVVKGGITFSNAACHMNLIEVP